MYQVWQYLILWMLKVKAGMGIWKIIIGSEIEQDKEEWLAYPPPPTKNFISLGLIKILIIMVLTDQTTIPLTFLLVLQP